MWDEAPRDDVVCAAEVIGALCLATDVGMAFPFEHGLHSTLIAMRLGERLGVDHATASETYYASLLAHSGCTTDAWVAAEIFGGGLTTHLVPVIFGSPREQLAGIAGAIPAPESGAAARALQVARGLPRAARLHKPQMAAMCDVARSLSEQLGLPASVQRLFADLTERWDGQGVLGRAEREEIPLALRITHVAQDAAVQRLLRGEEVAADVIQGRAGHAFDPEIAACLADDAPAILSFDPAESAWEETLACEPAPRLTLEGEAIDRALAAMGGFADLISPFLAALAPVAEAHHERLDRSGYHRGAAGAELTLPARVLAAADAYHAMTEPRPHRRPLTGEQAAAELADEARAGRLDADAVTAVIEAAGQRVPRLPRPAGLTEREAEVLGLLARGLQTKQIARALGISVKTADRHIQNAYAKTGVSTRAAATLFAMEHGLIAWGELPISRPASRS